MVNRTPSPTTSIDGVFNLRDIGRLATPEGRRLRPERVFRADGLHRTDPAGRDRVRALGIEQVIDLRTERELEKEGRFEHPEIGFAHVPILENLAEIIGSNDGSDQLMRRHYRAMSNDHGDAFAAALDLIARSAEAERTVVYHCTAGKDRTGVLTAIILAGLGIDDELIAADYARSAEPMQQLAHWYRENESIGPEDRMKEMGIDPSLVGHLIGATAETMLGFLDDVRTDHGTVDGYLGAIGASAAMETIGARLLI